MKHLLWLLLIPSFLSAQTLTGGVQATGTVQMGSAANVFIGIAIAPATASVVVNATQTFTFTITNDVTNKGAALTLVCSATPPGCGSLSASTVTNGGMVTYTAPPNVPSIPSVTLTATSMQDPSRFASAVLAIAPAQGPQPTASFITYPPNFQTTAASNVFPLGGATQGSTLLVLVGGTAGSVFTTTGMTDSKGDNYISAGSQCDLTGVGHVAAYYAPNAVPGVTSFTLPSTTQTGAVGIVLYDISNANGTPVFSCNSSATAITNPQPTGVAAQPGGVVFGLLEGNTVTAVNSPFTFQNFVGGNGSATLSVTSAGTYAPQYTQSSSGWIGENVSFQSGNTPAVISVNSIPMTSNVQISTTQVFTVNVFNDSAHAGTTLTLVGSGCSGSACGTLSSSSVAAGGSVTYTAPSIVPGASPTVNLTARSVTDGTKVAVSTITITSAPVLGITVAPSSASTTAGGATISLTPTITNDSGSGNATVALNCAGCGSLSASTVHTGSSVTYTPPASLTSNITAGVVFTSVTDSTKSVTSSITVTPASGPGGNPTPVCPSTGCPAFPGAQGGGASASGGRGQPVVEITNLNDSGTGSYRNCVTQSNVNCVFRVAGIVSVTGGDVSAGSNLTIYGQSAPGQVIIGGPNASCASFMLRHSQTPANDIVRYLTFSEDNINCNTGPDSGSTGIGAVNCSSLTVSPSNGGCYNIIWDHLSVRWASNKTMLWESNFTPGSSEAGGGVGTGPTHNVTASYILSYEPSLGHPVGIGTESDENCNGTLNNSTGAITGPCVSPYENNIDLHHSMFMNTSHRIPENSSNQQRWINVITYNWYFYANEWLGAGNIDVINNHWACGNLNSSGPAQTYPIHFTTNSPEMSGAPTAYVAGNIGCGQTAPNSDQYGSLVNQITGENGNETGPIPSGWQRNHPLDSTIARFSAEAFPVAADPAVNLDAIILPTVGNSQHVDQNGNWVTHRDSADSRVINQYKNRTAGGFWPNGVTTTLDCPEAGCTPSQVIAAAGSPQTPWTDQPVTNFPLCTSSLHDGICDSWKTLYGLSTVNTNLYKTTDPNTQACPSCPGFTYLEVFMAGAKP